MLYTELLFDHSQPLTQIICYTQFDSYYSVIVNNPNYSNFLDITVIYNIIWLYVLKAQNTQLS